MPYRPARHYQADIFAPVLATARINGVVDAPSGTSDMLGSIIVPVPTDVSIATPADLWDLLNKKNAGLLAKYAAVETVSNILWDDLLDTATIDFLAANVEGRFGSRGAISIPLGKCIQSTVVPLPPGPMPTQAISLVDVFLTTLSDDPNGRPTYTYSGYYPDDVALTEVSFDGGLTFTSMIDGAMTSIPGPSQGTDLVVRITNTGALDIHVGSWAVIY